MSNLTWSELAGRLRGAWSILRHGESSLAGDQTSLGVGGIRINKHQERISKKKDAEASKHWAKRAKAWHLQHSRTYSATSIAQGHALAKEALQGSVSWRDELRASDEWEYWSGRYCDNLFSIAISALDDSSEEHAREACGLHAAWKTADGVPLSARELEQAAGAVQRSCWWEVAEGWYSQLGALAKEQALSGAMAASHENAYGWVQAATWCFESINSRVWREGGHMIARERAAWKAYCDLPWARIELSKEIKDWLGRKMGSVIMPMSLEEQEAIIAELDDNSTWRNVLEAIVKASPERRGHQSEVCDELWAMLDRAALEQDIDESEKYSTTTALRI